MKLGDKVKVAHFRQGEVGQIIEERGALGPQGALIFRVCFEDQTLIEVREDQLTIVNPLQCLLSRKG